MIVGTAGHIDHGKTALVRALTGIDADRLPEEKRRGITIDLGFAYKTLPSGDTLGFVDVPGHEKFIHNMLAGAAGIDFVLLIVAADDGVMPQTAEHLQIVDLLGLRCGVVALTKVDLVTPERVAVVTAEIRALLAPTGLADAEIFPVSSVTGAGVVDLMAALELAAEDLPRRAAAGHFRLAVDRAFLLSGAGVVVTGTAVAGRVAVDDRLCLSPSGLPVRVRSIHAQNRDSADGAAGQRCALNIAGGELSKDKIERGDWIVPTALHAPTDRIDVAMRLLDSEAKALRHWTQAHLHLGAAHRMVHVALLEESTLAPGGQALAQLVLDRSVGALHGDRFILRDESAQRTIGGGRVLDPFAPQRHRRTPERLAVLHALEPERPAEALAALLSREPGWVDLQRFAVAWNLGDTEAVALWPTVPMTVGRDGGHVIGIEPERWLALREQAVAALAAFHAKSPDLPGLDRLRLRAAIASKLAVPLFDVLLAALQRDKAVIADGPWFRLPTHRVTLTPADERLWGRIQPIVRAAKFEPPRVRDFAKQLTVREDDVRTLLRRLARMGKLVQVAPDHFYFRETVAQMIGIVDELAGLAGDADITAAMFRDRIGTGRKLAILILEFFDKAGVTVRTGDLRRVRRDRLETFGPVRPSQRVPA